MAGAGFYLEIDASDLSDEIERLRAVTTPERFNRAMYRVFTRTEKHVRAMLKKDLPKHYHVKAGQVSGAVGAAKVQTSGLGVGCSIPIKGERGSIGGMYKAKGGSHGWKGVKKRKYRVKASVVKAQQTVLPPNMINYGGMPPFRNYNAKRLNGLAFTRIGKARLPIKPVFSVAIPQMPMNRSREDVENDIKQYMQKRIEHEFTQIITGGR